MINFRLKLPPAVLDESKNGLIEECHYSAYTLDYELDIVNCSGRISQKKCYTHLDNWREPQWFTLDINEAVQVQEDNINRYRKELNEELVRMNTLMDKHSKIKIFETKLEAIRIFQTKYPTAHVGGSIGLFLRGVDLKRDLSKSDVDMTIDELEKSDRIFSAVSAEDFDYSFKHFFGPYYTAIDIRICPEPSFDVIEYKGNKYNVSKLRDILYWKQKYADKGVQKHIDDLETIKTGVRPSEKKPTINNTDLPF